MGNSTQPASHDALLTPQEAADLLRLKRRSVYRLVYRGNLPAIKVGHGPKAPVRIPASAVVGLLDVLGLEREVSDAEMESRRGRERKPR